MKSIQGTQVIQQLSRLRTPAIGRFLVNLALIAIAYFVFTGGQWNFFFVLVAALGVTFSERLYLVLERVPWAFWALLGFGTLVALLGLYRVLF